MCFQTNVCQCILSRSYLAASVTEPPSGVEPATEPPSGDTMGCAHVTDANLDQCLTICTSQVDIDVGVVGICVSDHDIVLTGLLVLWSGCIPGVVVTVMCLGDR